MNAKFLFGEAFRGLRRNLTITFAMIVTASISLVMLGVGILIAGMADNSKQEWVDRTEISIFVEPTVAGKTLTAPRVGVVTSAAPFLTQRE